MADNSELLAQFAINFYKQLLTENNGTGNIFFSPFSIAVALSMTLAGARHKTAHQLESALHITADTAHQQFSNFLTRIDSYAPAVTLNVANKMFLEKTFDVLKEYTDLLKEAYRSTIQPANFLSDAEAVRLEINKWVEEVTQSKIRDLIAEGVLSCETALVLVNAIYFKGLWDFQFNPEATSKREFHETKDKSTMVDMMYKQAKFRTGYCDQLKVTVLEIPYKGSKTSMVVLLPNNIGDLSALEEAMTASKISNLLASMGEPSLVDLNLPRFKLEQTTNLKKQLEAMGINDLFSDRADLSGISSKAQLKVSDAIHKAFVEVNEEGTEAAAATCVTMVARCAVMGMPFNVNHPFLFLIRSRDPNVILFMGSVRQI